jgi:hypothetical protein
MLPSLALSQVSSPVPYDATVLIDTVEALPGTHFGVKVHLIDNDIDLAGISLPFRFVSPYLTLDSVSYGGSISTDSVLGGHIIDPATQTVKINYAPVLYNSPSPTIVTTGGLLAELFFTLSTDAPPGLIVIDSINHDSLVELNGTISHRWIRINMADNTGENFYLPNFMAGAVRVMVPTDVNDDNGNAGLPGSFALNQNYPNPFNPSTSISFDLPQASHVKLEVFNVLGQSVKSLINKHLGAGSHSVEFDASNQPSGVYFYRLTYSDGSETRKMILVK